MPVFIIFVVFFFRYKNRKARYRLAEQALAAGQPLPEGFIRESKPTDQRTQGIRNTFTGIGLFIFLWAITGEFGIGAIGLLLEKEPHLTNVEVKMRLKNCARNLNLPKYQQGWGMIDVNLLLT